VECDIVPNGKRDIPQGNIAHNFLIVQWKNNGVLFTKICKFCSSLSKFNYCFPDSIMILQITPFILTKSLSYVAMYFCFRLTPFESQVAHNYHGIWKHSALARNHHIFADTDYYQWH